MKHRAIRAAAFSIEQLAADCGDVVETRGDDAETLRQFIEQARAVRSHVAAGLKAEVAVSKARED